MNDDWKKEIASQLRGLDEEKNSEILSNIMDEILYENDDFNV